jgi:hypothetical protein
MKRITITLSLDCRDDVPPHILDWMCENLAEYRQNEFNHDYEPEWNDPPFDGPPLVGDVEVVA